MKRSIATGLVLIAGATSLHAQAPTGKAVYDKWCLGCHGADGKGDGAAALHMLPRPRNFTQGLFQVRSTSTGSLPTDGDLEQVIDEGMPGTAMPGWKEKLSKQERADVITYVKSFSPFFKTAKPKVLEFGKATSSSADVIAEGSKIYTKIECFKCHGQAGRGDGKSAQTMEDDNKAPILPADLSQNWRFNGGGSVEDIYRTLRTGLDGTPMPSMSDILESKVITDEQLWAVAHYVRSLSPAKPPVVRDVVRAEQIEGAIPVSPEDKRWNDIEKFYVPLVGQIIVKPRWFAPAVNAVFVQAVHNGKELALRLTWDDRSKSPDPAWSSWQTRVVAAMEPKEDAADAAPATPGQAVVPADASVQFAKTAPAPASLPDMITLQFPRVIPTGMERPYFMGGSSRGPVYLWQWKSQPDGVTEATGKTFGQTEQLSNSVVSSKAAFAKGEWQLVLHRSLTVQDSTQRLQFHKAMPIPMAVFAWDGNSGEQGTRAAVSAWYFIYLDQPTPKTVYATPVVAMMLTAGFGLLVVVRAQRREKQVQRGGDNVEAE